MEQGESRDFKLLAYAKENSNRQFYNLFAQHYNEARKSTSPVQALSHLSQIKEDIKQVRATVYDRMLYVEDKLEKLVDTCDHIEDTSLRSYINLVTSNILILKNGGETIFEDSDFGKNLIKKESFKKCVKNIADVAKKETDDKDILSQDYDKLIDNLYKDYKQLLYVNSQYVGLTDVISNVITNGYPEEVKTYPTEKEYQEDKQQNNLGRPLDSIAPQEPIEKKVLELIKKAKNGVDGYLRYWWFEGDRKGLPNKNQLKKKLRKLRLVDGITDRTVIRRIEAVCDKHDIRHMT